MQTKYFIRTIRIGKGLEVNVDVIQLYIMQDLLGILLLYYQGHSFFCCCSPISPFSFFLHFMRSFSLCIFAIESSLHNCLSCNESYILLALHVDTYTHRLASHGGVGTCSTWYMPCFSTSLHTCFFSHNMLWLFLQFRRPKTSV